MSKEISVFENKDFGEIRTVVIDNEPWFVGKDIAAALGYERATKAVQDHVCEEDRDAIPIRDSIGRMQNTPIINESGLYSLILSSKLSAAKQFKRWITSDVLPTIRKTGGYIANDELFVDTYFCGISEEQKQVLLMNLSAIRKKDQIIAEQKKEIEQKDKEIEHKENVIVGLVEDIDLATKRQRINQILRFHTKNPEALSRKWGLLYSEFEKKYHINLSVRYDNYKNKFKPALKNKMDVIDRQMDMIPQLYEICCKLFENDFAELKKVWEDAITC